jgi:hypothetical protein
MTRPPLTQEQRSIHENGARHKNNLAAVLAAMQREPSMAAALAGMDGARLAAALAALEKSAVALNAAGKSPWLTVSGGFFTSPSA